MFIVIWGPIAAVYRLRFWAIPSFVPAFVVMGLGIGLDKTPGSPSPAAYVAASVSSACLGLTLLVWLFFGFFLDLERTYRFKPWKAQQDKAAAAAPGKPVLCPYTGVCKRLRRRRGPALRRAPVVLRCMPRRRVKPGATRCHTRSGRPPPQACARTSAATRARRWCTRRPFTSATRRCLSQVGCRPGLV